MLEPRLHPATDTGRPRAPAALVELDAPVRPSRLPEGMASGRTHLRRLPAFLVVEDNPDDEAFVARAFADSGINASIAVARDGEEALAWVRANPDVRFLLLDLNLPRMDGFDFLQAIRADPRTRHVPVVVFTSSLAQRDVERAIRLGATSYIQKPVAYNQFATAVRSVLDYWLGLNVALRQGV